MIFFAELISLFEIRRNCLFVDSKHTRNISSLESIIVVLVNRKQAPRVFSECRKQNGLVYVFVSMRGKFHNEVEWMRNRNKGEERNEHKQ